MPWSQLTNTFPAQIAPFEISKKNPLSLGQNRSLENRLSILPTPSTQLSINRPSTLPTSYQMPFEFGKVGNKIVPARNAVALIKYLHRRGKVSGDVLDIVASENVFLQQNIGRANDVNAFRARVAHFAIPNR